MTDISVMTEVTVKKAKLPAAIERFILQWGDLGGQWGVNRSVSQIQALLYLSERPLTAEDIAEALGMARSNVSNSLKELLTWDLIRRVPILGDRRDHYEAETDIWELLLRIAAARKEREMDPALVALRTCLDQAKGDPTVNAVAVRRLNEMLTFTETLNAWYAQMLRLPRAKLANLLRLGSRVVNFLPGGKGRAQPGAVRAKAGKTN
jgi:DNA-binding transcriptional regulator GbsR (MarR family)